MNKNLTLLKQQLKRKRKYSVKELKENLNIINDEELLSLIVNLLEKELEEFNLNGDSSTHLILFRCFEYLNWSSAKLELKDEDFFKKISKKLIKLSEIVEELINKKISVANYNVYNENINQLIRINNKIDDFVLANYPEEIEDKQQRMYLFLKKIVFDVKSKNIVKEILKEMPDLQRAKSNTGVSLFKEIFDEYIRLIKDPDNLQRNFALIMYFEKMVILFGKSYNDKSVTREIKSKLEREINKITLSRTYKKMDQQKILFHLKETLNIVFNNKKTANNKLIYKYQAVEELDELFEYVDVKNIPLKEYKNMKDREVITIDDINTKCMEDAISIKVLDNGLYEVGIYITDVTGYIVEDSPLDKAIEKRALTVTPGKTDLFSRNIAQSVFSLKEGKNSLVIAYTFVFNEYGEILDFNVAKAIINVLKNYNHGTYREMIATTTEESLKQRELNKLFCVIQYNRNSQNKINMNDFTNLRLAVASSTLVENYSIFLNEHVSSYFNDNQLPFIFRSDHPFKKDDIISTFDIEKLDSKELKKIVRIIKNTTLPIHNSPINHGVDVMKRDSYGCVTNPAREYDALINQRMVKKFLIPNLDLNYSDYIKAQHYITYLCHFLKEKELLKDYLKEEIHHEKKIKR